MITKTSAISQCPCIGSTNDTKTECITNDYLHTVYACLSKYGLRSDLDLLTDDLFSDLCCDSK